MFESRKSFSPLLYLMEYNFLALFSCRTESAAAQAKTFHKGDVGDVSKFLSASTDLVASMLSPC